jgi:predicted nucleic acid-binding protein
LRKKQLRTIGSGGAGQHRIYVDTSAWIAFFSARDQNHAEAERLFRQAASRNVLLTTTNLVLAEVYRLILHRVGAAAAALALDRIESSARTAIAFASEAHHTVAMAWLARLSGHRVTYTDATGFAVIEDLRCTGFISFDSDFRLAGFRPWPPA